MRLGTVLHHGKLVGPHGRCTDVPDLTTPDKVVKGAHSLFYWGVRVKSVYPKQIEIVRLQSLECVIDGFEQCLPRKT